MKEYTFRELKEYCEKNKLQRFVYPSPFSSDSLHYCPIYFQSSFSKMRTMDADGVVWFSNENGSVLRIAMVSSITVESIAEATGVNILFKFNNYFNTAGIEEASIYAF